MMRKTSSAAQPRRGEHGQADGDFDALNACYGLGASDGPQCIVDGIAAGTIDVSIAHEKRTYLSPAVLLEDGSLVKAGPIQMTIKSFEPSSWGDGFELRAITEASLTEIIRITAILEDGQRVPLEQRSTMSFNGTTDVTLSCETHLGERAAIEFEAWHDSKTRRVPFEIRANVGLK